MNGHQQAVAAADFVKRPSGVIVPGRLAAMPEAGRPEPATAYDEDGRRRVVLTKQDQKVIDKAILILTRAGLGVVVCCRAGTREDGKEACGQPMLNEGRPTKEHPGTPDSGYGCQCSRVHFVR